MLKKNENEEVSILHQVDNGNENHIELFQVDNGNENHIELFMTYITLLQEKNLLQNRLDEICPELVELHDDLIKTKYFTDENHDLTLLYDMKDADDIQD